LRRLTADIEVSPFVGTFWRPGYKVRITHDNIISDAKIICIAYKWEDEDEVYGLTWNKRQDDAKMIRDFLDVVAEADELVGHNIDNFDIKWIRTRALVHGIPMPPTIETQDTLKLARRFFRFPSNRLDAIARHLEIGQKIKTDYDLWRYVALKNNRDALEEMLDYCKQDVRINEEVWSWMMQYVPAKAHYGDRGCCPECGSDRIVRSKQRPTAQGTQKIQYQCQEEGCGKYHTVVASKLPED